MYNNLANIIFWTLCCFMWLAFGGIVSKNVQLCFIAQCCWLLNLTVSLSITSFLVLITLFFRKLLFFHNFLELKVSEWLRLCKSRTQGFIDRRAGSGVRPALTSGPAAHRQTLGALTAVSKSLQRHQKKVAKFAASRFCQNKSPWAVGKSPDLVRKLPNWHHWSPPTCFDISMIFWSLVSLKTAAKCQKTICHQIHTYLTSFKFAGLTWMSLDF